MIQKGLLQKPPFPGRAISRYFSQKMQLKAQDIYKSLSPLHKALFIESNPSPVKFAASLLKLSSPDVRLPLVEVKESTKNEIKKALKVSNLL